MTPSNGQHGGRHRLASLLGMRVTTPDGNVLGRVNDVRLAPTEAVRGGNAQLTVDGIIVGDGHAGSFLGYDRRAEQGPRLVRWAVRALHRHAGYVPWDAVDNLDWADGRITLNRSAMDPLGSPNG